jgi:hypothetical protein
VAQTGARFRPGAIPKSAELVRRCRRKFEQVFLSSFRRTVLRPDSREDAEFFLILLQRKVWFSNVLDAGDFNHDGTPDLVRLVCRDGAGSAALMPLVLMCREPEN